MFQAPKTICKERLIALLCRILKAPAAHMRGLFHFVSEHSHLSFQASHPSHEQTEGE